jgi:hypothetical protein
MMGVGIRSTRRFNGGRTIDLALRHSDLKNSLSF